MKKIEISSTKRSHSLSRNLIDPHRYRDGFLKVHIGNAKYFLNFLLAMSVLYNFSATIFFITHVVFLIDNFSGI